MASVYSKKINGKTYYYLRQMARVDGKPKMVSERYLGSAADIEAAVDRSEAGTMPDRTRHLRFGDVAAAWSMLTELDVTGIIDEVVGPRRRDAGASVGIYLALAALGRLVQPGSKSGFADFWAGTAGDRFTKISSRVLNHRKFWDAMHTVTPAALQDISTRLAAKMITAFDLDTSSVALDMAGSRGESNTDQIIQRFRRRCIPQRLTRPGIQAFGNNVEVRLPESIQCRTLREILPKQTIGVFISPSLPRALRVSEIHSYIRGDSKFSMVRQLQAPIPGQRLHQPNRKLADLGRQ